MLEFLGELLADILLAPLLNAALTALLWLARTLLLLVLWPVVCLRGGLQLWARERGRVSLGALWREQGFVGLHRAGWQEAALDLECLLIAGLLLLALVGVGLLLYALGYSIMRLQSR